MIKDKQGLETGTYIFSKTGLMSGKYTFSRNKKNKSSNNKESLKKKTPSNIVKQINSKNTQEEEKYAKNKRKTINNNNEGSISNVAKDSQKETTHVKEAIVKNRLRNEGQQSFDDSVIIQKVKRAFGFNNDMVINGNEDNNLDGINRKDLEGMLIEGMRAYMELQKELNSTIADFNGKAAELGKMWAKQYMSNYFSCIEEMANQIISCQSTLKYMKLDNSPQLKNFCNYIPLDPEIAALWPKREGGLALDPNMNDFDNSSNTSHLNTSTNYGITIPHDYKQMQYNPMMNKNPFINKNNPLTNKGATINFYSYSPIDTNMVKQDQTDNSPLNNSQMMETCNYPDNSLNYDYGNQPIINIESIPVSNDQNLNLW